MFSWKVSFEKIDSFRKNGRQACLAAYETETYSLFDAKPIKLMVAFAKNGRQVPLGQLVK